MNDMNHIEKQLMIEDSFYRVELSLATKIVFVTYFGNFDVEKYKEANFAVLDLFEQGKANAVIADHRNTDPLPKEVQKWFVHDLSRILKTRFGKQIDQLILVAIINSHDPVRKAIAGFLVYMLKLFIGVRCYYVGTEEEALACCGYLESRVEDKDTRAKL